MTARLRAASLRALPVLALSVLTTASAQAPAPARPNVLWITSEDMSQNLGCYGDPDAVTPNLDALARRGVRYTNAFATSGVCAPARSTLITGMYAPSIGTHHMRCQGWLPAHVRCFTESLREAGYYCSNRVKTDYNFQPPPSAWDDSSRNAHWRNREPGQPFFSVFNFTVSHESQVRLPDDRFARRTSRVGPDERHDPAHVAIPPYHPDTPVVRRDWARYHDLVRVVDLEAKDLLRELEEDGLSDDTIVFYFSDHGAGLPRCKRCLYDSGLRVPLIVLVPERYRALAPGRPGSATDRLVSFVDFAPTVLSLAGVDIPEHMQGRAFLGEQQSEPRRYVFGCRDRMDERYDMQRAVRDRRFKYVRNFMPHLPPAQHVSYMWEMPTMREWARLAAAGALVGPQQPFMAAHKPREELYDTWADPHEVHDLSSEGDYGEVLARLRRALDAWITDTRDLGFLPEADLRARFGDNAPYDAVRAEPETYPLGRILAAAELGGDGAEDLPRLCELLGADDAAVRYWAAVGLAALGTAATPATEPIRTALEDRSPSVRLAAADALCNLGEHDLDEVALPVLVAGLAHEDGWVRLHAANILDRLGARARPALVAMRAARDDEQQQQYVVRVIEHALAAIDK